MAQIVKPSIFDLAALDDPLLSSNYRVVFEMPSGLKSSISAFLSKPYTSFMGAGNNLLGTNIAQILQTERTELLALRCSSVSMGKNTITPVVIKHKGQSAVYAGMREYDNSMGMTFVEDQDMRVMSILRSWMSGVRNAATYKGSGRDNLLSYTGSVIVIGYREDGSYASEYVYENAWPTNVDNVQLGGNNEIVAVTATFAYDRCGFFWEWKEALWNWIG
jgi:hypothetical protein